MLQNQETMIDHLPRLICFVLFTGCLIGQVHGQQAKIHSLQKKIAAAANDTTKVNLYYSLSRQYWNKNTDSAMLMADKAIELATELHFEKGLAMSYLSKGITFTSKGRFPEALEFQLKSLVLSEKLKLDDLSGNINSNIGIIYSRMRNYEKAREFYERSLAIMEKFTPAATISVLINLGDVCEKSKEYGKALEYDFRALELCRKEEEDGFALATLLCNLGSIHLKIGKKTEAIDYLEESSALSEKLDDREGLAYCYNLMAEIYQQNRQWKQSTQIGLKSLALMESLGSNELKKETYHILSEGYRKSGDYKTALYYKDREVVLKDSLITMEKEREVNNLLTSYKLDKKQQEIDLLNKDRIIKVKELEKKRQEQITFISAVIFLVLLAGTLLYANREHHKSNQQLRLQKEEIIQQKELITHQNQELQGVNRIKDRLLAVIGHDLRGPLNSLGSLLLLMQKKSIGIEEIQQLSTLLTDELKLTRNLLENLLTWARYQLEDSGPSLSHFDLKAMVEENLKLIDRSARLKGVIINNQVQEKIDLHADQSMIDIVIRNLVSNAVKYCREGDHVSVSFTSSNDAVYVSVKDTGIGMSETVKSSIFSIGSGTSQRGTSNEKGAGLGLGLCKELIEKNKGTIVFESELGKGSRFTFSIPFRK